MWLRIPTYPSSPASGCSTSPSTSLCQALAASVTVSGKVRQPQYWRRAWQTEAWTKHLSSAMCDGSQADSIVAEWLESLAVSPAKTSASPAAKQASTATGVGSFLRSSDLFASWNPSSGFFSKTSLQSSLFPQELPYSENLPRSGSMRSGPLFARPTVARRIEGTERSSSHLIQKENGWPTPRGTDGAKGGPNQAGSRGDLMLPSAAAMWTTPQAHDSAGGSPDRVRRFGTKHGGANLADDVTMWSTPNARDVKNPGDQSGQRSIRKTQQGWSIDLNDQAAWWSASSADTSSMRTADDTVARIAKGKDWPTPSSRDYKGANSERHIETAPGAAHMDQLANFVVHSRFSHPAPATPTHGRESSPSGRTSRRRLNPTFVEWLMGLPVGWTDFAALETGSWRSKVRRRLESFFGGMENDLD